MTSITANLSSEQRRLMNVLHDHSRGKAGMDAFKAINTADADHEDAIGLALAGLMECVRNDHVLDLPGMNTSGTYIPGNTFRLTTLGTSWVTENPLNKLLRHLIDAPRGTYDLRDASGDCDDDKVIVGAVGDGYATLNYKGDKRETKFESVDGRYEFRHGDCFVLIPTSKIRTVLGPATGR